MDSDDEMLCCMMDEMEEGEEEDNDEDWMDTSWAQPKTDGAKIHPTGVASLYQNNKDQKAGLECPASCEIEKSAESKDSSVIKRMLLNDNKAGMEGLDKEKINQIIHEASKGSKFYENERMKEEQMKKRIEEQKKKIRTITETQMNEGLLEADKLLEDLDKQRDLSHTIVHIDMDAFYAAVEMRDRPDLKDKPMAVGGTQMLSTSNYHARKFGVRATMPGFIGKKLCPELILVPLNFDKYTTVSKDVRSIFTQYDTNFCPMSLDEAYLDITEHLEQREAMSDLERTFICRDREYVDSMKHCLCDLNEIARIHGSTILDDRAGLDVYSYLMNEKNIMEMDLTSEDKRTGGLDHGIEFSSNNTSKDIRDFTNTESSEISEPLCAANMGLKTEHLSTNKDSVKEFPAENKILTHMLTKTIQNSKEPDIKRKGLCITGSNNEIVSRPICPVCHKEFPPFYHTIFGLTDEEAVLELRTRIEQKTRLTASAGIAPNMMLAKVCSDKNKPNGQYKVPATKSAVIDFVRNLPLRKISGIGKVSEAMLNALDVYTCTDLYERRALLYHLYSQISFNYFMRICLGIGSTTVERDSERKSMSTERTFSELSRPADLYRKCEELCECLAVDLKEDCLKGKTVGLKIKTVQFEVKTKAQTVREYTNDKDVMLRAATELLRAEIQAVAPNPLRLRLMGVRMSNLLPESHRSGKKQKTILGAFKKMTEKQKDKNEHIKTCSAGSDYQLVSNMEMSADKQKANHDICKTFANKTTASDSKIYKNSQHIGNDIKTTLKATDTLNDLSLEIDADGHFKSLENERTMLMCDRQKNEKDGKSIHKDMVEKMNRAHVKYSQNLERRNEELQPALLESSKPFQGSIKCLSKKEGDDMSNDSNVTAVPKAECADTKTDTTDNNNTNTNVEPLMCTLVESTGNEIVILTNRSKISNENEKVFEPTQTMICTNSMDIKPGTKEQNMTDSNKQFNSNISNLDCSDTLSVQSQVNSRIQSPCDGGLSNSNKTVLAKCYEELSKDSQGSRKTRSGLVITPNRKAGKSRRNSKKGKSVTYTCPVCSKEILCGNLNEFNEHVDDCLEGNIETVVAVPATSVSVSSSLPATSASVLSSLPVASVSASSSLPATSAPVLTSLPATSVSASSSLPATSVSVSSSVTATSVSALSSLPATSVSVLSSAPATSYLVLSSKQVLSDESGMSTVPEAIALDLPSGHIDTPVSDISARQICSEGIDMSIEQKLSGLCLPYSPITSKNCDKTIGVNELMLINVDKSSSDDREATGLAFIAKTASSDTVLTSCHDDIKPDGSKIGMEPIKPYFPFIATSFTPETSETDTHSSETIIETFKTDIALTNSALFSSENDIDLSLKQCTVVEKKVDLKLPDFNSSSIPDKNGEEAIVRSDDTDNGHKTLDDRLIDMDIEGQNEKLIEETNCDNIKCYEKKKHNVCENVGSIKGNLTEQLDKSANILKVNSCGKILPLACVDNIKSLSDVKTILHESSTEACSVTKQINISEHVDNVLIQIEKSDAELKESCNLNETDLAYSLNGTKLNAVSFKENVNHQKGSKSVDHEIEHAINQLEKHDYAIQAEISTQLHNTERNEESKGCTHTQTEDDKSVHLIYEHTEDNNKNNKDGVFVTDLPQLSNSIINSHSVPSQTYGISQPSSDKSCSSSSIQNHDIDQTVDTFSDPKYASENTIKECTVSESIVALFKNNCDRTGQMPSEPVSKDLQGCSKPKYVIDNVQPGTSKDYYNFLIPDPEISVIYNDSDESKIISETKNSTADIHSSTSRDKSNLDIYQNNSMDSDDHKRSDKYQMDDTKSETGKNTRVESNKDLNAYENHRYLEPNCAQHSSTQNYTSESFDGDVDSVNSEDSQTLLVCPVCNIEQRSADLTDFNDHVDACLSKGTITEILRAQREKGNQAQKRQSTSPVSLGSSQPLKRRKTVMPQKPVPCRSIISFFKEK